MTSSRVTARQVVSASCGTFHAVLLDAAGEALCAGDNDEGQADASRPDTALIVEPVQLAPDTLGLQRIRAVAAGSNFTLALNQHGVVLSSGCNEHGALGHSFDQLANVKPGIVQGLRLATPVAMIAAGEQHALFLSATGEVYSTGRNHMGQRALQDTQAPPDTTIVPGLVGVPVAQIAAGAAHSVAVDAAGAVYAWGHNRYGQLGLPRAQHGTVCPVPSLVPGLPEPAAAVAAGWHHTLILSRSGAVFATGKNSHGQLGCSPADLGCEPWPMDQGRIPPTHPGVMADVPQRVASLASPGVRDIAAGERHSVFLDVSGAVWVAGANDSGQLGRGELGQAVAFSSVPRQVPGLHSVFSIAAGGDSCMAVSVQRGSVLSYPAGCLPIGTQRYVQGLDLVAAVHAAATEQHFTALKALLQAVFGHASTMAGSCLLPQALHPGLAAALHLLRGQPAAPAALEDLPRQQLSSVLLTGGRPEGLGTADLGQLPAQAGLLLTSPQPQQLLAGAHLSSHSGSARSGLRRVGGLQDASSASPGAQVTPTPAPLGRSSTLSELAPTFSRSGSFQDWLHSNAAQSQPMRAETFARPEDLRALREARSDAAPLSASASVPPTRAATVDGLASPLPRAQSLSHTDTAALFNEVQAAADGQPQPAASPAAPGAMDPAPLSPRHSMLDVLNLEAAFTAIMQTCDDSVVETLAASLAQVLAVLDANAEQLTEPSQLRALLMLMLCPLNSVSTSAAASSAMTLLCSVILRMPAQARLTLFAWIRRDVPANLFAARIVSPLQQHLSALFKRAMAGQPRAQLVPAAGSRGALNVVAGMEMVVRVLRCAWRENEAVLRMRRAQASCVEREPSADHEADLEYYRGMLAAAGHAASFAGDASLPEHVGMPVPASRAAACAASPARRAVDAMGGLRNRAGWTRTSISPDGFGDRQPAHGGRRPVPALKIDAAYFYNADLAAMPDLLLQRDYERWALAGYKRTIANVAIAGYPFLLPAETVRRYVLLESALAQQNAMQASLAAAMFTGVVSPYCVLRVRRDHLVSDALNSIARMTSAELRKPLRVEFQGEQGVDAGGVKQEFFQLLTASLFDPACGLFTYDEQLRRHWFHPAAADSPSEFMLIGAAIGLAIFNGVQLDVTLAAPAYRLLLNLPVELVDLWQVQPELASGLAALADYPGKDVEDVFCVNFEVSYSYYGTTKTVPLMPGGADTPVTAENKALYVRLYALWVLQAGVATQIQAFLRGFHSVLGGHALQLCSPEELELLVCGTPELDTQALESAAHYEGGWDAEHPTVQALWQVVHSMSQADQQKFLKFCTGTSRAPIGGLANLKLTVQRNGPNSDRLPTSSTCFNTLLLPEYDTREHLQERLLTAIQECEGFGLE